MDFGQPPQLLSTTKTEFRNDVIHKGRIPSRDEAINYGQAVLDVIRPILKQVRKKYPAGKLLSSIHESKKSRRPEDGDRPVQGLNLLTILEPRVAMPEHNERSLVDTLAMLQSFGRCLTKLKPPGEK